MLLDICTNLLDYYKVIPVTTEEYGLSKAARPFNSRLDKSKLEEAGFTPLTKVNPFVKTLFKKN